MGCFIAPQIALAAISTRRLIPSLSLPGGVSSGRRETCLRRNHACWSASCSAGWAITAQPYAGAVWEEQAWPLRSTNTQRTALAAECALVS